MIKWDGKEKKKERCETCACLYIFFIPSIIFSLLLQLSPSRNSDRPLGHVAGTRPPSPLRFVPSSFFIARRVAAVSCVADLRRIVGPHAMILIGAFCKPIFAHNKKPRSMGLELAKCALVVTNLNHYLEHRGRTTYKVYESSDDRLQTFMCDRL